MTINIADNSPRISYSVADGVTQTSFAVPFEFFDDEDLNVYVDGTLKTLTSDYTVAGGDGSTGTVTISVTGASGGSTVVITRDITLERTTDFPVSGAFNIVALNTELDRLVAVAADLDDRASRALQLTDYDVAVGLTLPDVDTRKGKTLAFNLTTGAVEAGPSTSDVQSVSDTAADIALLADIQDGTIATNALTNLNSIRTDVTTVSGISSDVTTVSTNNANVTTVATDLNGSDTIGTVAGSISNVNTVATDITNVNTTATNIADVNTVAGEIGVSGVVTIVANAITDVSTVSDDIAAVITAANDLNEAVSEIDTVANAITNVDTVGTNIANVNTVAGISSDVTTVAADGTDIGTVATNITNVNTVAGISSNVTTVAGISADVTTVAADGTDIGTVAGISSDVTTVSGISGNVTTVAGISANVTTVAGISANVTTVAGDTANIGTIATDLNGSDNIGTVAGSISNVNSVGGAISDVTTVASNLTDVQSFANTYRIGTTDPTTSLDTGDLFFNTSSGVLKVYNGSAWEAGVTAGSGFMPLTGGTFTGDVSFGDNDKAIFGAGSDLQIYHDGSNSYIDEDGAGSLYVRAYTGVNIQSKLNDSDMITATHAGAVNLYHNGSAKLATESGGVNVTGTLTSDGLTVNAANNSGINIDASSNNGSILFTGPTSTNGYRFNFNDTNETFAIDKITSGGSFSSTLFKIDINGDISFYEDTGTTAKFFWDASAESLGIGTSSPARELHIASSQPEIRLEDNVGTAYYAELTATGGRFILSSDKGGTFGSGTIEFQVSGGSEAMRIDSSGNLLVGTTSTNPHNPSQGQGIALRSDGRVLSSVTGVSALFNRNSSDGDIVEFRKDGATVGSIGTSSFDLTVGNDDVGFKFHNASNMIIPWNLTTNGGADNTTNLGDSSNRFKDLYLSGGVVETTTTVSYASSIALTYDNGSIQTVTLTGNVTFTDSLADGEAIVLMLNAGASYTVTWTAVTKWVSSSGNAAPTLTANDTIVLWKIGSTVYAAYAGSYT